MACGTPVAAAAVGGVPEIVQDGAPGIVVANRSVESWSDALNALVAARWSPQAVRAYAMDFGWDEVIDRQCGLYEAVARQHHVVAQARASPPAPLAARR